ncbi:uncharacterized protein LOC133527922 [Cydia pomonella]|uniref:uncharacterized protein LOC133527922 n=1 Tax=Cydia pomonella TaxID=82600 RepID=UPI002ADE17B8|nr:uncharacterized protein LOC133527922 [Cydia pomonella]
MTTPKTSVTPSTLTLDMNDSRTLTQRRGTLKGKLTLFAKYVATLNQANLTNIQKVELQLRINNAASYYQDFDVVQTRIEELADPSDLPKHLDYREEFEGQYYQTVAAASELADVGNSLVVANGSAAAPASTDSVGYKVKLPTISLPTFDGSYEHWLGFRDTYTSLIHDSKDLGAIQKFHYLRAALTGTALQVIKSLEFSAENYTTAWELLENRFNNHRLLTHNYVKSLFNTQSLNKESATQIRRLIDSVLRSLRALKTLGEPTDSWDTLVIYLIVTKLDASTEREWEEHKGSINFNRQDSTSHIKLTDLITFLQNRADMLESISANHSKNTHSNSHDTKKPSNQSQSHNLNATHSYASSSTVSQSHINKSSSKRTSPRICQMCSANHPLYSCNSFLDLTVPDKVKLIEDKKLCHNCLRAGHTVDNCFFGPCRICQKKHNSLIHSLSSDSDGASASAGNVNNKPPTSAVPATSTHHTLTLNSHTLSPPLKPVLLCTAIAVVADSNNKLHRARVFLDNGSEHSYVAQSFIDKLKTPLVQSTYNISGLSKLITQTTHSCQLNLQSITGDYHARINCMVLPVLTEPLPTAAISAHSICIPDNIQLADPNYFKSSDIDILLGGDYFWGLLNKDRIPLAEGPYLQDTKLGWIVVGPINNKRIKLNKTTCHFTQTLDAQLKQFWELEEVPKIGDGLTDDERACEQLFASTTQRDKDGRFLVRLPLKESADALGDTYDIARSRFLSLERKLERLPEHKKMYCDFMREYIELGHMSLIHTYTKPYCFLVHHSVLKDSLTTRLRVVFNGSMPTSSGKSLNDLQLVGPTIQNDIFSILLRFREHRYVACADVAKMYRQILIQPDQRNLQLILWRENPSEPLNIYQLNTVTFGTSSGAFLAIRCLNQLAKECADEAVSRTILEDCYVDDLITGNNDKHVLIDICEKVTDVLQSGCFPLRKWVFNFDVSQFSSSKITSRELCLGDNCQSKTLGLGWTNNTDEFHYTAKIQQDNNNEPITKRKILSVISQMYDPLGLLSPAIIIAKILLQKLWLCRLDWDSEVPEDVASAWRTYILTHTQHIHSLRIPRYVMNAYAHCTQLHFFCDASQAAYGACAYVRTLSGDNNEVITVHLLCSKSKVAPLKSVSIAKLELLGALLAARLYSKIMKSLKVKFDSVYFWCDSTIVLGWIRMSPHTLKTFVQNRVSEINELTGSAQWLHSEHIRLLHAPPSLLLATIKDCWWPLGGTNLAKRVVRTCVTCIRMKAKTFAPIMDPNDLSALTPAHFLIGRPLTAPPYKDLTTETGRLPRYKMLEKMRQHFWQRWSKQYISELQTRTKWQTHGQDIVHNSLVLVKEDNLPPLKWRLGRVVALFTGNDGVSRVADVKTASGVIRRAFTKLCPLLMPPESEAAPTPSTSPQPH